MPSIIYPITSDYRAQWDLWDALRECIYQEFLDLFKSWKITHENGLHDRRRPRRAHQPAQPALGRLGQAAKASAAASARAPSWAGWCSCARDVLFFAHFGRVPRPARALDGHVRRAGDGSLLGRGRVLRWLALRAGLHRRAVGGTRHPPGRSAHPVRGRLGPHDPGRGRAAAVLRQGPVGWPGPAVWQQYCAFGYNFPDLPLAEDRQISDTWEATRRIGRVWASVSDEELLTRFWHAVEDGRAEASANMSERADQAPKAHKRAMQQAFGSRVVVATDADTQREAEYRGLKPVQFRLGPAKRGQRDRGHRSRRTGGCRRRGLHAVPEEPAVGGAAQDPGHAASPGRPGRHEHATCSPTCCRPTCWARRWATRSPWMCRCSAMRRRRLPPGCTKRRTSSTTPTTPPLRTSTLWPTWQPR